MSFYKEFRDQIGKFILGNKTVPSSLVDLHHYFRFYGPINFNFERQSDGSFVAYSTNFRYGSIITSAPRQDLLDDKVKDAILTAFEVPSSYAKEAAVKRQGEEGYAFA